MSFLENRAPPPLVMLAVALVMAAGAGFSHVVAAGLVAGLLAMLLGAALVVAGFAEFRRAGTTIDPVHIERAGKLVETGIFRFSRNPMYVGFALALIGWGLVLGDVWTLLGPLAFVLYIQRFQIAPEERAMGVKFGAEYDAYRQRVRRWV